MASSALAEARAAAVLARREPTAANLSAVRAAIAAAQRLVGMRHDARGYNPNRAKDGKFAPGAHKQKSAGDAATKAHVEHTAGERAAAETALTGARKAKATAVTEARARLAEAKAAATLARKEPSAINVKAAKQATARAAEAATLAKQHAATVKEHAAAHAAVKAAHIEAKKQHAAAKGGAGKPAPAEHRGPSSHATAAAGASHAADHASAQAHVSGVPADHTAAAAAHDHAASAHRAAGNHGAADEHSRQASEHRRAAEELARPATAPAAGTPTPAHGDAFAGRDAIRSRIAEGIHGTAENVRIDPATQAALRDSNNRIMAAYGVTPRLTNTPHAHIVQVDSAENMGGGYAAMHNEQTNRAGLMSISHEQAVLLREHMKLSGDQLHDLARRSAHDDHAQGVLFAAHVMHHETMHGHGPSIEQGIHRTTIEELTTEVAARKVTADMHGVPSHSETVNLTYHNIVTPIISKTAAASGTSHERAYEAIEHASLSLKRQSGKMSDDEAIGFVANKAAEHLGQPAVAGHIANGIYQTSNKIRMGQ